MVLLVLVLFGASQVSSVPFSFVASIYSRKAPLPETVAFTC